MLARHVFNKYRNGTISNFIEYLEVRITLLSLPEPFVKREVAVSRKIQHFLRLCWLGSFILKWFCGHMADDAGYPQFEIVDDSFECILDYLDIQKTNFFQNLRPGILLKTMSVISLVFFINCHVLHIHFSSNKVLNFIDDYYLWNWELC